MNNRPGYELLQEFQKKAGKNKPVTYNDLVRFIKTLRLHETEGFYAEDGKQGIEQERYRKRVKEQEKLRNKVGNCELCDAPMYYYKRFLYMTQEDRQNKTNLREVCQSCWETNYVQAPGVE